MASPNSTQRKTLFEVLSTERLSRTSRTGFGSSDQLSRRIHRYVDRNKHGEYPYWVAAWTDPVIGKRKSRKFSISKHGSLRAKQMAREARMRGVAGMRQADEKQLDTEQKQVNAILDFLAS